MRFCKYERCRWYGDPGKYGRRCYYEPQCILGWLDMLIDLLKLATRKRRLS